MKKPTPISAINNRQPQQNVAQPKRPVAPPVYRPQPVPKVLQTKRSPAITTRAPQAAPKPIAPTPPQRPKGLVNPLINKLPNKPVIKPPNKPVQMKTVVPVVSPAKTVRPTPPTTTPVIAKTSTTPGRAPNPLLVQRKLATSPGQVVQPAAQNVIQQGRTKQTRKKRKKHAGVHYGSCEFSSDKLSVARAVFFDRPPSNSRRGQGDHIVSYTLITQTVSTLVRGKALDEAGQELAELVGAAKQFVKTGGTNSSWHGQADALIGRLNAIDPATPGAQGSLRAGINDVLKLLNIMPGTAMKNVRSTGGHGESSILETERKVKAGKTVHGNIWVNVLKMFDGSADRSLMEDSTRLDDKLAWLMSLFQRAAPTIYALIAADNLTLIPDTDLGSAASAKFGALKGIEVALTIQNWIDD